MMTRQRRGIVFALVTALALSGCASRNQSAYSVNEITDEAFCLSTFESDGRAALELFTTDGPEEGICAGYLHENVRGLLKRAESWIQNYPWNKDGFGALLGVLDTAITNAENVNSPDARVLASATVGLLANRIRGVDADGNELESDTKLSSGGLGPVASRHLAHILGTYMQSVDYYVSLGDLPGPQILGSADISRADFGTSQDMPVFSYRDLKEVFRVLLSTKEGFAAARQALTTYQDARYYLLVRDDYAEDTFGATIRRAIEFESNIEAFFVRILLEPKVDDRLFGEFEFVMWIRLLSDLSGYVPAREVPGEDETLTEFLSRQEYSSSTAILDKAVEVVMFHPPSLSQFSLPSELGETRANGLVTDMYLMGIVTVDDAVAKKVDIANLKRVFGGQLPTNKMIVDLDDEQLNSLISDVVYYALYWSDCRDIYFATIPILEDK